MRIGMGEKRKALGGADVQGLPRCPIRRGPRRERRTLRGRSGALEPAAYSGLYGAGSGPNVNGSKPESVGNRLISPARAVPGVFCNSVFLNVEACITCRRAPVQRGLLHPSKRAPPEPTAVPEELSANPSCSGTPLVRFTDRARCGFSVVERHSCFPCSSPSCSPHLMRAC